MLEDSYLARHERMQQSFHPCDRVAVPSPPSTASTGGEVSTKIRLSRSLDD
ncbi:hypothetical protein L916_04947 [Phytophthora nicotianae]|uniref:Uncharacterized protein n=1 Tax=Phytophthora nicotianae TaxID=4792 RepID=W2JEE6_PHYNI|nr:hypothetical protein L916_04947 [Phytophthora nicotianae]